MAEASARAVSEYGPLLLPGLRPLWRDRRSLQLGRDPNRAIVLEDIGTPTAKILTRLDGTRSRAQLLADATAAGLDAATVADLLCGLEECGLVVDGDPSRLSDLGGPDVAERLEPDCVALGLARPHRPAISTVRERRGRLVVLHGAGRLGAPVGALLAAAGVGRLAIIDEERSRPCDVGPAGIAAADIFQRRADAATAAIRRAAPEAQVTELRGDDQPDLAILAGLDPVEPAVRESLHRLGLPYLPVDVQEATVVVGPLVLPGRSACLGCTDLNRRDADPAWPLVVAQLGVRRRRQREPADVVFCTLAAALAAGQALEFLDGERPAAVGATLELRPPGHEVSRREWPAHPECDCGAATPAALRLAG